MTPRGEDPLNRGSTNKNSIQDKVATLFYSLGLLCSSYPTCILVFSIAVIVGACLPLLNIPLPLTSPHQEWISSNNLTDGPRPYCYVQQVILKAAVLPWEPDLILGDAFRAPLYESFKLLDIVRNYEDGESHKTLGHVCLHIEAVAKGREYSPVMPQYSCLVLSPANLWHQDINLFSQDSAILTTIYNQHKYQKGKISVAEMLFGLPLRESGFKRYPLRHRQRVIQFAVTLFFKEYDKGFIQGLHEKLITLYPLHQNNSKPPSDTLIIHYPEEIDYLELSPLIAAFIMLFLYYYFYVRKIDDIKSKAGLSFAAMFTVLCSLLMTMGICFIFGLTVNCQRGKWIFPYLAILLGLENVLVLTKSVLMTPLHLDAKIRLAQGLSKEGWSTTKNLLIEITILTFGLFTFVPLIQEFCIFVLVSLCAGLFLQIFFFSTVLSMDLNRASNTIEKTNQSFRNALYQPLATLDYNSFNKGMSRSRSHPRLSFPANVVAGQKHAAPQEKRLPKRLRMVNIWARTRFFQRSFMILMIIWICMIIYNGDLINNYFLNQMDDRQNGTSTRQLKNYLNLNFFPSTVNSTFSVKSVNYVTYSPLSVNGSFDIDKLKPSEHEPHVQLATSRFLSLILSKYNISVSGKSVAVLPSIKLAHVIRPDQAAQLRNPEEKYGKKLQWQALAAALDPIDFNGDYPSMDQMDQPFYPRSPMEIMLLSILICISVIVLAYGLVVLYKCVCSRNYAEWRASWYPEKNEEPVDDQVLLEAVPVVLDGHAHEVECIATDGVHLASVCLAGQLKIWDNSTGELLTVIDRKAYFTQTERKRNSSLDTDDISDYESGSPPSRDEVFPTLVNRINPDFSNLRSRSLNEPFDSRYELYKSYKYHYISDKSLLKKRKASVKEDVLSSDYNIRSGTTYGRISSVWCMDYVDNMVIIGCADGRLEFWEATTQKLKCIFEDGNDSGVTHVKMIGSRVVAARLCGSLDFMQLQTYNQGRPIDWNFSNAYRRTHIRTGSMGSEREIKGQTDQEEDLRCIKLITVKAHPQPITCLDCEGGRIVTGSQDHTLKVYRVETADLLYTLHGHCGPITCMFIDRVCPATSGSGSQDGMVCVWDLLSGTCMYSTQAHDGAVISLTYSASYVISLGMDERLCVWERFQGHLLNTILVGQVFSNHVLMLASHLVVTGKNGGLVIWDVRNGECIRTITLGRDPFVFINQLILLRDAVLCDYGRQLRIVRFPLITHKFD
ncbi:sterol regulatory element-binding protein cleavage-activating protein [Anthonomus grandis grandis]|uniref:sterol regulatory element-binding protein cleavage-activating protein n=1 Tax=Anthonomus grandis grandis TaxID=2921223 RepID=UPI002166BB20|nr:sterol regulatory element-binding protein cleavage-activating protein [Anthonomus grandis grandis]